MSAEEPVLSECRSFGPRTTRSCRSPPSRAGLFTAGPSALVNGTREKLSRSIPLLSESQVAMISRFIVHRHKTERSHFDLLLIEEGIPRCWSLLKAPPSQTGEHRLAIETESSPGDKVRGASLNKDAFGEGKVYIWDEGDVEIKASTPRKLVLVFSGKKLAGGYEMLRMLWYPGNRWLLRKSSL
jgi:DNA ligase D-like protein (predicted 3'-phosphoesterase)